MARQDQGKLKPQPYHREDVLEDLQVCLVCVPRTSMASSDRPIDVLSVSEFIQTLTVMKWSLSTAHPGREQTREQLVP